MAKRPRSDEINGRVRRAMNKLPRIGIATADPSAQDPPDAVSELLASASSLTSVEAINGVIVRAAQIVVEEQDELASMMMECGRDGDERWSKTLENTSKGVTRCRKTQLEWLERVRAIVAEEQPEDDQEDDRVWRREFTVVELDGTTTEI